MDAPWFRPVVAILWIAAMSWLTVEKVLPQLNRGDPPTYRSILASGERATDAWTLYLNDQDVGEAESRVEKDLSGATVLRHRLNISRFRFQDLLPEMFKSILSADLANLPPTNATIFGTLTLDNNNQLKKIEANVRWGDIGNFIRLNGVVHQGELRVFAVAMGNVSLPATKIPIATQSVLCESLAPLGQMPGLRIGQTWTLPAFSPLQPTAPVEFLRAEVARAEPYSWNGTVTRCLVIEYTRTSGVGGPHELQGQTWVRDDGLVLKQESRLLNARLAFIRRPTDATRDKINSDNE